MFSSEERNGKKAIFAGTATAAPTEGLRFISVSTVSPASFILVCDGEASSQRKRDSDPERLEGNLYFLFHALFLCKHFESSCEKPAQRTQSPFMPPLGVKALVKYI